MGGETLGEGQAHEFVERPQEHAAQQRRADRQRRHGSGLSQTGKGEKGHQEGHGGCLHHQEEEREAEPLPFSQKIEEHRDRKHADGAHAEGQQEAEGVDEKEHTAAQTGPAGARRADQIEGEKNAQRQEAGQNIGVAEDAGDADTGLVARAEAGIIASQGPVHHPDKGGGEQLERGAVDADEAEDGADGGGHGGQIPRLAPACPEQHHTEHTEGAEDLTELPGGKAAEPGIEPGRAVEEEVGEHRQHRDRKTVAQAPLGHSAEDAGNEDQRHPHRGGPVVPSGLEGDHQKEQHPQNGIAQRGAPADTERRLRVCGRAPGRGGRPDRCGPGLPTVGGGGFRTRRRRGNIRSLPGRLGLFF